MNIVVLSTYRQRIIEEACSWLATPYCHQAATKGQGADCLGLVRGVYEAIIGSPPALVPDYPRRLAPSDGEVLLGGASEYLIPTNEPQPADVILFRMRRTYPVSHCGILIDRHRFVHAYEGHGVISTALSEPWKRRSAAFFAFPEAP